PARRAACGWPWCCRPWRRTCAPRSATCSASPGPWRMRCCPPCAPGAPRTASRCWTTSGAAAASPTTTPSSSTGSTWTSATACRTGPCSCSPTSLQTERQGGRPGPPPLRASRAGPSACRHDKRSKPVALDFLILYEHTVREYESDLLLKLELERRGYAVEIRQLLDPKHLRLFRRDKPEVLVASCMYDNEAINSHVYNNIGRCDKIVNLHWEQMLSDTQEEGDWFNMNGNAKRCIQTCWGERTARRLQAHGMDAKNTPVTGAVMMDFLRPEFKGYFKDKAALCREFGLDPAKQLHLYISSFGYASMSDAEVAELSKMAGTD